MDDLIAHPRILLVGNSTENLFAYKTMLSGNYEVVVVSSGHEALRCLMRDEEFALILLEVVMPDLNGFKTARLIRARKNSSAVPIIFISASPNDEIQKLQGYSSGAVDFIFTPINPEVLKAKVSAFINLYSFNKAREHDLLTQRAIELEQFAYVASHDLKAPLRTISNFLQLLSSRYHGKLDREADEYIHFAVEGAQRLTRLVDDLLEYTKAGSTIKKTEGLNVGDIVREVVKTLNAQIEESGAEIVIEALPSVSGDRNHLTQLFQNLISNAIAYRGDKSLRITVSAEIRKFKGWTFSVRDNGNGFDMKHSSEIFKMFKTMNSKGKGTGIGLAICKKIAEAHGGKIWVQSAPGEGTTFFFSIPDSNVSDRSLDGLRVLIVDDAVEMRALAASILQGAGVTSDFAFDGREGVEKARFGIYDVVLMDVMMPKLNGLEAAASLRKSGITSPIIAFTSMANDRCLQDSGFTDYLSKENLHDTLIPFLRRYGQKSVNVHGHSH